MSDDSSAAAFAQTLLPRGTIAGQLARGMTRHLSQRGFASVTEFTLPNGRRADLMAVGRGGEIWIVEIKSSIEDYRADLKWRDYRPFCDKLFFATHAEVPDNIFPDDAGLFLADAYDGHLLRDCAPSALNAATRKVLLVQFGQIAAHRLARFLYPDYRSEPSQP